MAVLDITRSIDISAPLEKVWAAITEGWTRELGELAEYLATP